MGTQTRTARTAGGAVESLPTRTQDVGSHGDSLNRDIIRMLQEDGRMPYAEIAAALDVSEGTIRNRVNAMKRSGHLRIVAIADPTAVEYRTEAMLGIKVAPGCNPPDVAERLGECPEVVYVLWVSGRYDLWVEVVGDDREAFLAFLGEHVHGQADIASVETMTGLKNFKNQFMLKRNWT